MENLKGLNEDKIQELRAIQQMAKVHVDASQEAGGNLALLDINLEKYPAQDTYHIKSTKVDRNPINLGYMGTAATESFPALQESLRDSLTGTERLDTMASLLKGKNNIAITTNHGDLTDVALALDAYTIELLLRDDPSLVKGMKTALILSRIVSFIGIKWGEPDSQFVVPATDTLQYLCDDQFLTLPRTETIEKVLTKAKIRAHNSVAKRSLFNLLNQGGVLLAVAPSGTKDKQVILGPDGAVLRNVGKNETTPDDDPKIYRMAAVTSGTADILTYDRKRTMYTALTSLWLNGDKPVAELCDNVRLMENQDDISAGMNAIGSTLEQRVPGHKFVYAPYSGSDSKKAEKGFTRSDY